MTDAKIAEQLMLWDELDDEILTQEDLDKAIEKIKLCRIEDPTCEACQ
jgi:hypothetical protein